MRDEKLPDAKSWSAYIARLPPVIITGLRARFLLAYSRREHTQRFKYSIVLTYLPYLAISYACSPVITKGDISENRPRSNSACP